MLRANRAETEPSATIRRRTRALHIALAAAIVFVETPLPASLSLCAAAGCEDSGSDVCYPSDAPQSACRCPDAAGCDGSRDCRDPCAERGDPGRDGADTGAPCCPVGCQSCHRTCCGGIALVLPSPQGSVEPSSACGSLRSTSRRWMSIASAVIFRPPRC